MPPADYRRLGVVRIPADHVLRGLSVPDDVTVVGIRTDWQRDTIELRVAGDRFDPVEPACEPPVVELDELRLAPSIDVAHLERQRAWSEQTFGPGPRTAGVLEHLRRELLEVEAAPDDLSEWADVVILALDGAWRAGHDPAAILEAIAAKQTRNEARTWPDWRTMSADEPIEHDRTVES